MKIILAIAVAFIILGIFPLGGIAAQEVGYGLVWSEEFNSALDTNVWSPRTDNTVWSYYSSMVSTSNGNLVLTATRENGITKYGGVISKNKYNFKYGYIEIRAKVVKGNGFLSGLWLTGQNNWPPELDIVEYLGKETNAIYETRHCSTYLDSTCDGSIFLGKDWWKYRYKKYVGIDWSQGYHNYGLEWTPSYVRWLIDGIETFRVTTGIPKEPMWITLSECVNNCSGGWSGPIDSTTILPSRMYVDYVRVYRGTSVQSPITTLTPNGGENLIRGTTKAVKWNYTAGTGSYVNIELLKGGVLNRVIASSTPNDGSFESWTIHPNQTLGSDYKIKIASTSNSAHADESNNNFAISTGTSISTNLVPNPGLETDDNGDSRPDGWSTNVWGGSATKIAFAWATDYKYKGSRSTKIASTDPYGKARWMTGRNIPVTPGKNYNLGGYVRTNSVGKAYICTTFWNSALSYISGSAKCTGSKGGTNSWSLLQGNIVAPTGAAYVRIEPRLEGTGTVWYDDIMFKAI